MIPVSGLEENALQFNVYPNPAKDRVVIEGIEAAEVNVYNALGQVVKTVQGSNEINVGDLPFDERNLLSQKLQLKF